MNSDSNKKVKKKNFVPLIVLGIVVLLGSATLGAIFLNAPPNTSLTTDKPSSSEGVENEKGNAPYLLGGFEVDHTEGKFTATTTLTVLDKPDNLFVEYRIEDSNKKVVAEGTVKNSEPISDLISLSSGENILTLKVRTATNTVYTNWVVLDQKTVVLPSVAENSTTIKVNTGFYDTAWAKKEEATVEALKEALTVGYDAPPVTVKDACMRSNSGTVSVGEIFPPKPHSFEPYVLKSIVIPDFNDKFEVTYAFCETQK